MEKLGYLEKLKQNQRDDILKSIAKNGLNVSTQQQRLRSSDNENFTKLAVNLVDFNVARSWSDSAKTQAIAANQRDVKDTFQLLTYSTCLGAWNIAIERKEDREFNYYEWQQRISQSVYILFRHPKEGDFSRKFTNAAANHSYKFIYDNRFYSTEAHLSRPITCEEIVALIVPKALAEIVTALFKTDVPIITVENTKSEISLTKPKGDISGCKFTGPDYAEGLQRFCRDNLTKFGAHVVRLPIGSDMYTAYNTATKEGILAYYLATSLEQALRKAARYGHVADIHYLISLGAAINAQDDGQLKRCALHWALDKRQVLACLALLQNGASRAIKDASRRDGNFYARSRGIDLDQLLRNFKTSVSNNIKKESDQQLMEEGEATKMMASLLGPDFYDKLQSSVQDAVFSTMAKLAKEIDPNADTSALDKLRVEKPSVSCYWLLLENQKKIPVAEICAQKSSTIFKTLSKENVPGANNTFSNCDDVIQALRVILNGKKNANGLIQGHIVMVLMQKEKFINLPNSLPAMKCIYTYSRETLPKEDIKDRAIDSPNPKNI